MSEPAEEFGKCVLCGDRVKSSHFYLTTSNGYVHKNCLTSMDKLAEA